ncbi:uncharacterized protein LOC116161457 [Photinus pyralis]|uniref:uncharacterized protein LOC116161457 n=1 Tax=Photinus pyralis TaxID=7054 RepID=UPI001266E6FF|nr:uncharacterized protein LOC116161457 [Photinus pyralis]
MLFAILLGLTIARTETANLPSYFPKCYQDDPKINECFVNAANSLNQYVRKGIPEIGLRPLDPFVAPPFTMTLESPITDYNATLRGFTFERLFNYQFISAEIRPKDGVVGGKLILPDLDLKSNYTVEGHIINLPLQGGGYFKIANSKIVCDFLTSGWQEKKNCNGINLEITCKIEDLKVNITGLANGIFQIWSALF